MATSMVGSVNCRSAVADPPWSAGAGKRYSCCGILDIYKSKDACCTSPFLLVPERRGFYSFCTVIGHLSSHLQRSVVSAGRGLGMRDLRAKGNSTPRLVSRL